MTEAPQVRAFSLLLLTLSQHPKSILDHGLPARQQTWPQTWPLSRHMVNRQALRTVHSLSPLGTPTAIGGRCPSAKAADRKLMCRRDSAPPRGPAPANAPSWPSRSTAHSKRPHLPFRPLTHLRVKRAGAPSTPHPHAKRGSNYSHTAHRSPAPGAKASAGWV